MNLQGKTALVTGGATGLGLAITKQLLEKGMQVAICGRTQSTLDQAKAELNSNNLSIYQCDISDYSQVESMIKQIGPVDVLINNAGVWLKKPLESTSPEEISTTIDCNLKGTIYVTRQVLPGMKQKRAGYIINIISKSGLRVHEGASIYVAAKYGVRGFTDTLVKDLRKTGVRIAGVYPTGMNVPEFFSKSGDKVETREFLDVDKVAEVIIFMLETESPLTTDHVEIDRDDR